jgi:ribosomal protein L3 glutamine methyltransferase
MSQLHTVGDYIRFAASEFNRADLYFGHGNDNAWDEATTLVFFALALPENLSQQVLNCRLTDHEKQDILTITERRITEQLPAAYITHQAKIENLS